jgi:hypothetical protein
MPALSIRANVGLQLRSCHCIRGHRLNNQSSVTLDTVVGRPWKFPQDF